MPGEEPRRLSVEKESKRVRVDAPVLEQELLRLTVLPPSCMQGEELRRLREEKEK